MHPRISEDIVRQIMADRERAARDAAARRRARSHRTRKAVGMWLLTFGASLALNEQDALVVSTDGVRLAGPLPR